VYLLGQFGLIFIRPMPQVSSPRGNSAFQKLLSGSLTRRNQRLGRG
jgi:hypothetical protein